MADISKALTLAGIGEPTEVVELHIECEKLADMDYFSKSDPVWEVFLKNHKNDQDWVKLGETEKIENNLNPKFVKSFEIKFYFEREQKIKVGVYDQDLISRDHIGDIEISIAKIMGSHNQKIVGDLFLPGQQISRGKIILSLERVSTCNDFIHFDLRVNNLPSTKTFLWGTDDPFYFIERSRTPDSDDFIRVFESGKMNSTLNPHWLSQKHLVK